MLDLLGALLLIARARRAPPRPARGPRRGLEITGDRLLFRGNGRSALLLHLASPFGVTLLATPRRDRAVALLSSASGTFYVGAPLIALLLVGVGLLIWWLTRPIPLIAQAQQNFRTSYIGAKAGNLLQREANVQQMEANDNTVGWVHRLVTHELRLEPGGCADVGARGLWDQIAPPDALAGRRYAAPGWSACVPLDKQVGQPIEGARLRHCRLASSNAADAGCSMATRYGPFTDQGTFDYNGPLWNVRVDKALMNGHNGNWNPKFLSVLHQVLFD